MRIFGIDPGSGRTGYGCVETDGRRYRLVTCGAITAIASDSFPQRLARIYRELTQLLASCRPECVAVENLFHGVNARSALTLGHARGVAMLAAVEAECEIVEYTPAEVKRAVVGYGRADKRQMQQMVKLLLGLDTPPSPHDAADALAIAICHLHSAPMGRLNAAPTKTAPTKQAHAKTGVGAGFPGRRRTEREGGSQPVSQLKSWRQYRPPAQG